MFYFLQQFGDQFAALNVFRYLTFRTGGATITALFIVFIFGPQVISHLKVRQGHGQPIREDGPQSHLITKKGTPTMGGLMILVSVLVSTLLWANLSNPYVWVVLGVTVGFGAIGFYDDYLKVSKATNSGFGGRQRLVLESVIAAIACYSVSQIGDHALSTSLAFPFIKDFAVDLGIFFVVFGGFIIVAAGNSVNLTDGLMVLQLCQ